MRAITKINIKENINGTVTMYLTYNNKPSDYGFNNYESIDDAISHIHSINDPYFPVMVDYYLVSDVRNKNLIKFRLNN